MGRTLPTIIQTLELELEAWKLFRRALRREDQEAFDALWRHVRRHAAPASMASRPVPLESVFMAMLVGVERRLLDVEGRLAEKENHGGAKTADPEAVDPRTDPRNRRVDL